MFHILEQFLTYHQVVKRTSSNFIASTFRDKHSMEKTQLNCFAFLPSEKGSTLKGNNLFPFRVHPL